MGLKAMGKIAAAGMLAAAMVATPGMKAQAAADTVLRPADMQKLIPATVYYKGQTATTQVRNSGGVKFADGYFVLTYMVDTSGYSSDVAAKYQAYFITEVPLKIVGQSVPAGVYGIGFVKGKFVVTDVGGHDVLTTATGADPSLKRPVPLMITPSPTGGFRLYGGRKYVTFSR
jgi:hypothetical protein